MAADEPIRIEVIATAETFDERGYLISNPDVRAAVASGAFATGRQHFEAHGYKEDRKVKLPALSLDEPRRRKLERLAPYLRRDMPHESVEGRLDYLSDELRRVTRILATDSESANGYDWDMQGLVERFADGLVLDCGAGRRAVYYPNVVNLEIVAYDSTDILAVGEALPFVDDTFDCVFSVAVLEHVRDPFRCADEICRVLKPGGKLFCSIPFLQPLHGFPHHYFNATSQGIRRLFEDKLAIDDVHVPETGHPSYALHWFLESWTLGLGPDALRAFRDMKVGDLVDMDPAVLKRSPYGTLPASRENELASAFVLRATGR